MTTEEQLQHELAALRDDYDRLSAMFENMGQGYEEALYLYDKAMESSRLKTNFIQQISHEIRTPLNILSGFAQILTSGMELDEATRQEVTKGIVDNTERITGLVNKMLELSDANSEAPIERSDQVAVVQIAVEAADASGITTAPHLAFDLVLSPAAEAVVLTTNQRAATRALTLILDNARKFSAPAEAHVRQNADIVRQQARLLVDVDEQTIRFAVEDTGIGIDADNAERVFDEFVQLDEYYDGTGIGLTVARSLVRRLGGDIVLDTSYSGGARFVMTLPR